MSLAAELTADPVFRCWFPTARPSGAPTRLFCLPHAGAGATAYRDWFARCAPDIDVLPVQLPGRESRIGERSIGDVDELAAQLAPVLAAYGGPRFALFGHSMGALIAYVMAHVLRDGGAAPVHLFVSGASAPGHGRSEKWHQLPDRALLDRLAELGGMPDGVLQEPELCRLMLPILRADLALCERYVHSRRSPLSIPITAMAGDDDTTIRGELSDWAVETAAPFAARRFPGGHFYPPGSLAQVINLVKAALIPRD